MLFSLLALGLGPTTDSDTKVTTDENGDTVIERVPVSPEVQAERVNEYERRQEILRAAGEPTT